MVVVVVLGGTIGVGSCFRGGVGSVNSSSSSSRREHDDEQQRQQKKKNENKNWFLNSRIAVDPICGFQLLRGGVGWGDRGIKLFFFLRFRFVK